MEAAETFHDPSILAAWKAAAARVASAAGAPYVLVLSGGTEWQPTPEEARRLDGVARGLGIEQPTSVAAMLCPRNIGTAVGLTADVVEAELQKLGRARRASKKFSTWTHTYFERLVGAWYDRFGTRRAIKPARLQAVIQKLNEWGKNAEAAFYIHTDMDTDSYRPLGNPCLQYVQFRAYGNMQLEIVGLYRSHDYTKKALGNIIGLYRLGEFVSKKTGRNFTGVSVISLNPFCKGKKQLKDYVQLV